jgi:hypothetical protein
VAARQWSVPQPLLWNIFLPLPLPSRTRRLRKFRRGGYVPPPRRAPDGSNSAPSVLIRVIAAGDALARGGRRRYVHPLDENNANFGAYYSAEAQAKARRFGRSGPEGGRAVGERPAVLGVVELPGRCRRNRLPRYAREQAHPSRQRRRAAIFVNNEQVLPFPLFPSPCVRRHPIPPPPAAAPLRMRTLRRVAVHARAQ